jgi:hypothetical protein
MFKLNKKKPQIAPTEAEEVAPQPIVLGVMLDGQIVDVFSVQTPRVASLFLHNPTFVDMSEYKPETE